MCWDYSLINRMGVVARSIYMILGLVMWVALLKSGVHATLAGVILAMFIPLRDGKQNEYSPLKDLEDDLHSAVAFVILPLFAFANAGINLRDIGLDYVFHNVTMGIICGLFLGKQFGIFLMCWAGVKLKLTELPDGMNWNTLYGVALLCGVGFTMSLFMGSLAFEETGVNLLFDERVGIIIGSLFSGIAGYMVLKISLAKASHS